MKCRTANCDAERILCRGLCQRCYNRLLRRVQRRTVTWKELESQGLCSPSANVNESSENRRQGQKKRFSVETTHTTYRLTNGLKLSKVMYDHSVEQYRRGYISQPGDMDETMRKNYAELLGLVGEDDLLLQEAATCPSMT